MELQPELREAAQLADALVAQLVQLAKLSQRPQVAPMAVQEQ